jgi:molybdopterin converting factor subunit 1
MVLVRLFAGFREKVNKDKVEIPVSPDTTLEDFIEKLSNAFPEIAEVLNRSQATIAVNHEVVEKNHIIRNDDEIALFPPVSGG